VSCRHWRDEPARPDFGGGSVVVFFVFGQFGGLGRQLFAVGAPCGAARERGPRPNLLGQPALERQAREASLQRDPDFSQRTLAEDYVAITPLGQVTTKQDTVSARKSRQLRYDSIDVSDMVVRLYGDTAVVTARADVKGHQLGEDFSGPYRYTRVWVRRSGHWQAVSYQATVTQ